jgi:hypothetical protein
MVGLYLYQEGMVNGCFALHLHILVFENMGASCSVDSNLVAKLEESSYLV